MSAYLRRGGGQSQGWHSDDLNVDLVSHVISRVHHPDLGMSKGHDRSGTVTFDDCLNRVRHSCSLDGGRLRDGFKHVGSRRGSSGIVSTATRNMLNSPSFTVHFNSTFDDRMLTIQHCMHNKYTSKFKCWSNFRVKSLKMSFELLTFPCREMIKCALHI